MMLGVPSIVAPPGALISEEADIGFFVKLNKSLNYRVKWLNDWNSDPWA
jgi:hypothetical protein